MLFLKIESGLLSNRYWSAGQKCLLAYFISLHRQGRGFWGSDRFLADLFGTDEANISQIIKQLIDRGVIYRDSEHTLRLATDETVIYNYRAVLDFKVSSVGDIVKERSDATN